MARERRSSCGCPSASGDESRPHPLSRRRYLFRLRVEPAASARQRGSLERSAVASSGAGSLARASVDQQEMLSGLRDFISKANEALQAHDIPRAQMLADKASRLADDLTVTLTKNR